MSESVLIAIISGQSVVIAALVTAGLPLIVSTRRHARSAATRSGAAVEELKNEHATNLRDDLDEKHAEHDGRIGRLEVRVTRGFSDVRRSVGRIEDHLGIERTQPAPPRRKK